MMSQDLSTPLDDQQRDERDVQNREQHQGPNNCFSPRYGPTEEHAAESSRWEHQQGDAPQPVPSRYLHASDLHNVPQYADLNGGAR